MELLKLSFKYLKGMGGGFELNIKVYDLNVFVFKTLLF